jgi:nucleoside 2-deoxyribosyltransferase
MIKFDILCSVYLAAGYDQQVRMRGYRKTLEDRGNIIVTSRWIDVDESNPMQEEAIAADEEAAASYSRHDLDDISRADIFIMFTDSPSTSGGRHTELGYALARDKAVFIVGPRENIFQAGEGVLHFATWDDLCTFISQ